MFFLLVKNCGYPFSNYESLPQIILEKGVFQAGWIKKHTTHFLLCGTESFYICPLLFEPSVLKKVGRVQFESHDCLTGLKSLLPWISAQNALESSSSPHPQFNSVSYFQMWFACLFFTIFKFWVVLIEMVLSKS